MKNRFLNKKLLGFIFMFCGIFCLIYPLTNLSLNEYMSSYRYDVFLENQKNVGEDEIQKFEDFAKKYNSKLGDNSGKIVDPFDYNDYNVSYGLDKEDKEKVFGYVKIPKIDAKKPIRFDASYKNLSRGVAHVDGTSIPVGGIGTRSVIAGHRGWYTDVMFLNLHKLEVGDLVEIELIGGKTLKYEVRDSEIIEPSEWEKITPIENKDMLTLLTCDPLVPPSPYRLIVNCERLVEKKLEVNSTNSVEEKKVSTEKTTINYTKYGIYFFTLIVWIVFFVVILKFVKYVKKLKDFRV